MVFKKERINSTKKAPHVPSSETSPGATGKKQIVPQKTEQQNSAQNPLKPIDRSQQQLVSFLSNLQTNFASLVHLFERRLSYDKTKEVAFDRLYQEMEELKQEQSLNELRPLYIDLILLVDRMEQIEFDLEESGVESPEVENVMVTLKHEVLEILYRRGVEQIEHTPEYFDATFQKVVDTEPTYNPSEDNLVVGIRRDGYRFHDVVLRPEEVVIKKFQG